MNYLVVIAVLFVLIALKLTKMAVIFILVALIILSLAKSSIVRDIFGKKNK
jgi:hypothetical protein